MIIPLWLQSKYVNLLAYRLDRFKQTNEHVWNFRCPICGDSKKSLSKSRGYIYSKNGELNYACKNCGVGTTFPKFLQEFDFRLYREMVVEALGKRRHSNPDFPASKTEFPAPKPPEFWQQGLHRVSKLPASHQARRYVETRLVPMEHWGLLFHTDSFSDWANTLIPGKYKESQGDPRLIIPFLNAQGELLGFQGRAYEQSSSKYLTASLGRGPLIFGVERLDQAARVLVTEGPIDSLFLPNAMASGGGDLVSSISSLPIPRENFIIIYDNERRSAHTVSKMRKAIQQGYRVCIWPEYVPEKDINDMVLARVGVDGNLAQVRAKIADIITEHSYLGLTATIKLTGWRRD